MFQNEGKIDRNVRVLVGLAILSLTVLGPKTWWGLLGLIPLITGFVGFCPLYRLLGVSTATGDDGGPKHRAA